MSIPTKQGIPANKHLQKVPTGIEGLDIITGGGLPQGRPTLVCGGAGCGKTLLAMEFLVRGALQYDEPGVFMSFEERTEDLVQNYTSLGFDLNELAAQQKLALDYVQIAPRQILETGEYDLEGLLVRLEYAIDSLGAKRLVLDTSEIIFSSLANESILRAEFARLLSWIKEKGITTVITGELGENGLTRYGLEEYVADCVIFLDHKVVNQVATRRLRIIKYRGTSHGTNEYPFLIDGRGFSILPITSLGLNYPVSNERISTGNPQLDTMMSGKGFYRGSSILFSGSAGTGKSSFAAQFMDSVCRRGERGIYFSMEESSSQIIRNMNSLGINLASWVEQGLLKLISNRPTCLGLEKHLLTIHNEIDAFQPTAVVIDPISCLVTTERPLDVKAMITRLLDYLKGKQVTALCTDLAADIDRLEQTEIGVSSLMDTWLLLKSIAENGERNRGLYILKSRGMAHSNQIREFTLSEHGIQLLDVYSGPGGFYTGASRSAQETKNLAESQKHRYDLERRQRAIERRKSVIEAQIAALKAELDAEDEDLLKIVNHERSIEKMFVAQRLAIERMGQHGPESTTDTCGNPNGE